MRNKENFPFFDFSAHYWQKKKLSLIYLHQLLENRSNLSRTIVFEWKSTCAIFSKLGETKRKWILSKLPNQIQVHIAKRKFAELMRQSCTDFTQPSTSKNLVFVKNPLLGSLKMIPFSSVHTTRCTCSFSLGERRLTFTYLIIHSPGRQQPPVLWRWTVPRTSSRPLQDCGPYLGLDDVGTLDLSMR